VILGQDNYFRPHHYIIAALHQPANTAVYTDTGIIADLYLRAVTKIRTFFYIDAASRQFEKTLADKRRTGLSHLPIRPFDAGKCLTKP
jgi:hypothetical protein